MGRFRTDVENLFLSEMVEEDMDLVITEDSIDDIIPDNTIGLFDDTTSGNDDVDIVLDVDDLELF